MSTALFIELRSAVFAKVSLTAVRNLSRKTFLHLLNLDMAFHMNRQTGGLMRAIDRGTRGINTVMNALLFHTFPTALEISLVCGIFAYRFGTNNDGLFFR